ncbi:uncharacterized protein [Euphorbia lathyris]|uniref:uncharacterized protein n=1 Tax=Euphorbia lathyris TaxID=212925 RepID=UPI00331328AE
MEDLRGGESVPQSIPEKIVTSPQVSIDSNNLRLQKAILRSIDSEISNDSVSETTLDSLERLEQIYREENIQIPESMIYAYFSIALHCSFRCLPENYVENILDRRISKLEMLNSELVTDELRGCRDGIRVLQLNSDARNIWKEKKMNSKYKEHAMFMTKYFVNEATSCIELVTEGAAEAMGKRDESESKEKETNMERNNDIEDCRTGGGEEIQGKMLLHKHDAHRGRYRGPPRIVDSDDLDSEIVSSEMGTSEVKQALVSNPPIDSTSSDVKQAGVSNPLIDESIKVRLDSPKRKNVSPLKLYELKKFTRRRRPTKIWSPEEEDALREGVKKYGAGNWKIILNSNRNIFSDRQEVDLKDKWRNLMRPLSHT